MKHKDGLKQFYNEYADHRNDMVKDDWKRVLRDRFLNVMKTEKTATLLEIGAGTGQDSIFFMNNGLEVKAVDLSQKHVDFCRDKGIDSYLMDFYNLSFQDDSFDSLYAMNCLLHVPKSNLQRVLSEIKRVVKKGGILFIGNYGGVHKEGIKKFQDQKRGRFFSFLQFSDYESILQEAGFIIIESEEITPKMDMTFNFFIVRKAL